MTEILGTEKVADFRWLKVFNRKFKHNGHEGVWTFVSRSGQPKLHEDHKPNAVQMVAETDDGRLVLTSEFRIPIGAREISFPAGLIDDGESAGDAAIREFKEETGMDFVPEAYSPPNLYSSAGLSEESIQIVFGSASGTPTTKGNEQTEDIEVLLMNRKELIELIYNKTTAFSAKAWCLIFGLVAERPTPKIA